LAGKTEFDLRIDDDEAAAPAAPPAVAAAPARNVSRMTIAPDVAIAPPPPGVDSPKDEAVVVALLTRLLPTGVSEAEYPLRRPGIVSIGRVGTDVALENDTMLSERHASVTADERGFFLRDDGSVTGTFLQLKEGRKVEVKADDLLRLGRQFLVFAIDAGRPSIIHYDATGREVARHALPEKTIVLGREAPDVVLDGADKTLSRRHLAISVENGAILVKDLKSVNGTFLQVRGAYPLRDGDEFRVGQQRFVLHDAAAVADKRPASAVVVAPPVPAPAAAAPQPPAPSAATPIPVQKAAAPAPAKVPTAVPEAKPSAVGGPSVSFKGAGKFPAKPNETICEIAEENGVDIVAECHAGICGSDPVRILCGVENVNPVSAQEKETLEDICSLEPGPCRLACMVKVKGAVEVEVLKK
jgi:pSer/pThr/pTyr-binding forkhead associated (FHA) protein/ferredoxin